MHFYTRSRAGLLAGYDAMQPQFQLRKFLLNGLNCNEWSSVSLQDLHSPSILSSRRSFSSTTSDTDRPHRRGEQPAYSFVGMQCIFDQCRASGNFVY